MKEYHFFHHRACGAFDPESFKIIFCRACQLYIILLQLCGLNFRTGSVIFKPYLIY